MKIYWNRGGRSWVKKDRGSPFVKDVSWCGRSKPTRSPLENRHVRRLRRLIHTTDRSRKGHEKGKEGEGQGKEQSDFSRGIYLVLKVQSHHLRQSSMDFGNFQEVIVPHGETLLGTPVFLLPPNWRNVSSSESTTSKVTGSMSVVERCLDGHFELSRF